MNGLTIYNGVRLQCDGTTLWATQKEIAPLFGVERSVITMHIQHIFESGEPEEASVYACVHILRQMERPIKQIFITLN